MCICDALSQLHVELFLIAKRRDVKAITMQLVKFVLRVCKLFKTGPGSVKGVTELRRAKIAATEEGTLGGDTVLHVINGETALQKKSRIESNLPQITMLILHKCICVSNG